MIERWSLAALVLVGCARKPIDATTVRSARMSSTAQCARHELSDASPYHLSLAGPVEDRELRGYLERVPAELRRSVLATGLEPLLAATLKGHGEPTSMAQLERRQELTTRLSALDSQLTALLFESDCTGDALDDLAQELERREHQRELQMTVASLVVGAAVGVAAAVYQAKESSNVGPSIVGGTGAGLSALLGVAAFLPEQRPVHLYHPRNLLRPIVEGTNPNHIFPGFVFRLLTLPTLDGSPTPREEMLTRWRADMEALPAEERAGAARLLFGDGGVYSPALMQLRQTMLDQLEARLNAITREVELLERYLLRATSADTSLSDPTKPL